MSENHGWYIHFLVFVFDNWDSFAIVIDFDFVFVHVNINFDGVHFGIILLMISRIDQNFVVDLEQTGSVSDLLTDNFLRVLVINPHLFSHRLD